MKTMLCAAAAALALAALAVLPLRAQTAMDRESALRYVALAEQAFTQRNGPEGEQWLQRLESEQESLLAALDWLIANREEEAALRLAGSLGYVWDGTYVEGGRKQLNRVLALPGAQERSALRARALLYAGVLAFRMRDQDAANRQIEESLAIARELGDKQAQSRALSALARNYLRVEDHAAVRQHAEAAMAIAQEIDDPGSAAFARHMLAYSAQMQGDLDRAQTLYQENVRVARALGDNALLATETGNLAFLEYDRGNYAAALAGFREYLRAEQQIGDAAGIADALLGFAMVEVIAGSAERGAQTLGAVQTAFERIGTTMDPATQKDFDAAVATAKERIGSAAFEAAFTRGRGMELERAVTDALQ